MANQSKLITTVWTSNYGEIAEEELPPGLVDRVRAGTSTREVPACCPECGQSVEGTETETIYDDDAQAAYDELDEFIAQRFFILGVDKPNEVK